MPETEAFQQFLANSRAELSEMQFIGNLVLAAILAFVLRQVYIRFGRSLSNRQVFASNFILLTMTTMLIITIVKSSLALSLGLVGALSIVRFRAAIKEPEELAYLFLTIAVGLGLGAGQTLITLIGFLIIAGILIIAGMRRTTEPEHNLFLSITSHKPEKIKLGDIVKTLKQHCGSVNLRRHINQIKHCILD